MSRPGARPMSVFVSADYVFWPLFDNTRLVLVIFYVLGMLFVWLITLQA